MIRYGRDRLISAGELLATDGGQDTDPESVVWALTREAAQTLALLPGLPRRGYPGKSAWPDFRDDDFFAVIRERLSDGIEGDAVRTKLMPGSAAISRCEIMWDVWRSYGFPRYGARRGLLRVVWAYAGGMRPAKIRTVFGVSRSRLTRAKQQGCAGVAKKMYCNNCNDSAIVSPYDREVFA